MYERIRTHYCRWVILAAIILRLASSPELLLPLANALSSPEACRTMLFLGRGQTETPEEKRAGVITVIEQPAESESVSTPDFSDADADAIEVLGSCTYEYDKQALLQQPLQADLAQDGPKILIVHTHGCEAYTPTDDTAYTSCGDFRTLDTDHNVNRVGEEMERVFDEAGIEAIHDVGCNDADGFTDAYDRMGETIQSYLEQYPSICMVLDVHRDAYENLDGTQAAPSIDLSEGRSARLMLVMGSDEGGRYHPNWQDNLSCALKVQTLLERANPGICRDMLLRQSRYNQQLTPCSLLVEVGAAGNTLDEAVLAGRKFAEAIVQLLKG